MKKTLQITIVLLLLFGVAKIWWPFIRNLQTPKEEPAHDGSTAFTPITGAQSEQRWLVDQIDRNIANILLHAKGGVPSAISVSTEPGHDRNDFNVKIDSPKMSCPITLKHYVWAEENYVPFASSLIQSWGLTASSSAQSGETLLAVLTSPEPATLIREGQRVTKEINEDPLSPDSNEEAALLLGTFALREAAGAFADVRPILCRMSAHLAVARVLRTSPGPDGEMASIIMLTLTGRETEALERLRPLETAQPAWVNALKLRNTGDWRLLKEPENASLLERLEWFRAAVQNAGVDFAVARLPGVLNDARTDWCHMVMAGAFSVQKGHAFAEKSLLPEFRELGTTWTSIFNKHLPEKELVQQLNISPLPGPSLKKDDPLEVLGWPDWAAFYQRHLCHDMQMTFYFLHDQWGVPEYAASFRTQMNKYFEGLTLYPVVQKRWADDPQAMTASLKAIAGICASQPEMITAANWACVQEPNQFHVDTANVSGAQAWLQGGFPKEAVYDFSARYFDLNLDRMPDWDLLVSTAPYNYEILYGMAWQKFGAPATGGQLEEAYRMISDYNINALQKIAKAEMTVPDAYLATMKKVCEMDPDSYLDVGQYLAENNRPEEAAQAYRNGFEKATDRVKTANMTGWIVDYDYTHGQKDEAEKIAADAAEVYSYAGLKTMGLLMEREARFDEAEKNFDNIRERYDDNGPLAGFYFRHRAATPRYDSLFEGILRRLFPNGMEKTAIASFQNAPEDGVLVKSNSFLLHAQGLKPGDVFVAIDGVRVHTMQQYEFVRDLNEDPHFTLIIWSSGQYREVKAMAPNRKFQCDIGTFTKS